MKRFKRRATAMAVAALSTTGWAQSSATGTLTGTVRDTTSAVLPGVTITARHVETNQLAARVRAGLRRTPSPDSLPVAFTYRSAHLTADFDAVAVAVDGAGVRLTRREFELLRYLVRTKNRVVSRDRLLAYVWDDERPVERRTVDAHVGRLRTKLGAAGRQIETVIGLGYRFVDEPEAGL